MTKFCQAPNAMPVRTGAALPSVNDVPASFVAATKDAYRPGAATLTVSSRILTAPFSSMTSAE